MLPTLSSYDESSHQHVYAGATYSQDEDPAKAPCPVPPTEPYVSF
jgi:hypothetical protein